MIRSSLLLQLLQQVLKIQTFKTYLMHLQLFFSHNQQPKTSKGVTTSKWFTYYFRELLCLA